MQWTRQLLLFIWYHESGGECDAVLLPYQRALQVELTWYLQGYAGYKCWSSQGFLPHWHIAPKHYSHRVFVASVILQLVAQVTITVSQAFTTAWTTAQCTSILPDVCSRLTEAVASIAANQEKTGAADVSVLSAVMLSICLPQPAR